MSHSTTSSFSPTSDSRLGTISIWGFPWPQRLIGSIDFTEADGLNSITVINRVGVRSAKRLLCVCLFGAGCGNRYDLFWPCCWTRIKRTVCVKFMCNFPSAVRLKVDEVADLEEGAIWIRWMKWQQSRPSYSGSSLIALNTTLSRGGIPMKGIIDIFSDTHTVNPSARDRFAVSKKSNIPKRMILREVYWFQLQVVSHRDEKTELS